jgi:transcriptional regulator with XRE-family HTH domain
MGQMRNDKLLRLIALKIKELRLQRNITQEDFYNDTTIHIARIETGKVNITVSTIKAICSYFNISLGEFFSKVEKNNN